MTIDPVAAVPGSGIGASSLGSESTVSTNQSVSGSPSAIENNPPAEQAGAGNKVDLFDYADQLGQDKPALDTLQIDEKAKYLSNPSVLGGQWLGVFEDLHLNSLKFEQNLGESLSSGLGGSDVRSDVEPGPAALVPDSNGPGTSSGNTEAFRTLNMVFSHAVEASTLSNCTSQFSKTISTLMRGQ